MSASALTQGERESMTAEEIEEAEPQEEHEQQKLREFDQQIRLTTFRWHSNMFVNQIIRQVHVNETNQAWQSSKVELFENPRTQKNQMLAKLEHISFVGRVQESLNDYNDHMCLIHLQTWAGKFAPGSTPTMTALVCCALPPWEAQTLDRLRLNSTVHFVGNIVGLYPDTAGKFHLCVVVADLAFITPVPALPTEDAPGPSTPTKSPRKRRLAQLLSSCQQSFQTGGSAHNRTAAANKQAREI
ncbi:hypothetical protein V8E54_007554 [Elaphomyces granulatus]